MSALQTCLRAAEYSQSTASISAIYLSIPSKFDGNSWCTAPDALMKSLDISNQNLCVAIC
jgi:hypothetical protein